MTPHGPDRRRGCRPAEFTEALPRAELYATWRTVTNSDATLAQIVSDAFDPGRSMISPPGRRLLPGQRHRSGRRPGRIRQLRRGHFARADPPPPRCFCSTAAIVPARKVLMDRAPGGLRCRSPMRVSPCRRAPTPWNPFPAGRRAVPRQPSRPWIRPCYCWHHRRSRTAKRRSIARLA